MRITNTSRQPVTAWSMAATTPTPTGGTHREVYTTDGYLSEATHGLPKAAERLERLMPGESRDLPLDPLAPVPKWTSSPPCWTMATATGDEAAIATIFANRVKERDALKTVVDVFHAVPAGKTRRGSAVGAQEPLTAMVDKPNAVVRAALDAVLAYTEGRAPEIDKSLRTYAEFVTREYELAAKHAERR